NRAIAALRNGDVVDRESIIRMLRRIDVMDWKNKAANLKPLDPPVLVHENVGSYNVVRFGQTFYGFPQSAGAFLPQSASAGEYDAFPHDASLEKLIETLKRMQDISLPISTTASTSEQNRADVENLCEPLLVKENLGRWNIVQFASVFYGFPQSEGPFLPERALAGQYQDLPHGASLEKLIDELKPVSTPMPYERSIAAVVRRFGRPKRTALKSREDPTSA